MKIFEPKIISSLKSYSAKQAVSDIVAGIIVAIIALPLSIALAIASGVEPAQGLYTAIVAGFVIALFGGSKVNISGPTAAFATIVAGIVATSGTSGLIIATIMAGVILILMGMLKLGTLIKYIPHSITTGFTFGIAVTIVVGQIKDFLGLTYANGEAPVETIEKAEAVVNNISSFNWQALLIGGISLIILIVWPKISKKIPGSLIAVIIGTLLVNLIDMDVKTIGDLYTIQQGFPTFAFPEFSFDLVNQLLPSAFTIAILAGIESLLSCVVSDGMINDKHNSNTELIAQGMGNICSGLFGGIPATGAIARTAANVKNGGKSPVSGMVHSVVLLLVLVALMQYAALIPMPVIAAILFMVAYNMCEWRQFVRICKKAPLTDIAVLVVTCVLTVVFDLVVAIEVGMLMAVILFMYRMSERMSIRKWSDASEKEHKNKQIPQDTEVYDIDGPMFFAASDKIVIPLREGLKTVILRMHGVPALDETAMRALRVVYNKCNESGIRLIIAHVNEQPLAVMKKDGFLSDLGEENIFGNIDDALSHAIKSN